MSKEYRPKRYWEKRLAENFNARGVGHFGFGDAYNEWLYRRKARVIAACFEGVALELKRVLDVGCGTGFFVEWYRARGAVVSGIDITEVSVTKLRERFGGDFRTQDVSDPEFRPFGAFDVVNMWDVMYHVTDPAAFERALDNVAASLADGGLFLCTDTFGAEEDRMAADHVRTRCLRTYLDRAPSRGLELVRVMPLYRLLNDRRLGRLDDRLGGLYFVLDGLARRPSRRGLSLAVWKKAGAARS